MGFSSGKNAPNNVDLTSSQTMSNKTLDGTTVIQDGATITTPDIISPSRLDVKKDTLANLQTYASSATNGQLCFATDTKQMFQVVDSALAEVSGGSGGINHIENGDYNQDTTGTTGDTNLVISQETVAPLRGDGSLKIAKGAIDASTQSVTIPFTIDAADLAQKLTISFDKDFSDANYNDGDMQVRIIQDPAGSPSTIRVNGEDIAGGKGSHIAQFQTDHTELDYALELYFVDTGVLAVDALLDNIQVGPSNKSIGSSTNSMVRLHTGNGHGSTNTTIRRFSTVVENIGGDITYTDSSTLGATFTINETGIYAITYGDTNSASYLTFGISLNSTELTTNISTINANDRLIVADSSSANFIEEVSWTGVLNKNDIIRAHDSATATGTVQTSFTITKIGSNAEANSVGGGREIVVEGAGNSGATLTAFVTDIDFTESNDTTSSWDGSIFTAPETGTYLINGAYLTTVTTTGYVISYRDTGGGFSAFRYLGVNQASSFHRKFNDVVTLNRGDKLSFRQNDSRTLSNSNSQHYIAITKLASPQTILETATVAAKYTSSNGQTFATGTTLKFEELLYDTHGSYNTTTGEYTLQHSGHYSLKVKVLTDSETWTSGYAVGFVMKLDGTIIDQKYEYHPNYTGSASVIYSDDFYGVAGQVLTIESVSDIATNMNVVSTRNSFAIHRIK